MTRPNPATLRLTPEPIRASMTAHGITSLEQLATEIGVGRATVMRAFSGRTAPGSALIAGIRLRLGLPFDQIVEVVNARRASA